jgi:hypothetical protein
MTSPHHDELFLAIGRLEGKVDSLLAMQQMAQDELKDHDARLRNLEHARGYLMGVSAAIGAIVSVAGTWLAKLVH